MTTPFIYIIVAENYPIAVHAVAMRLKPDGLMQEQDLWYLLNSMELSSIEPLNNIKGFFVGKWWKNQTNIGRIPLLRSALLDRGDHVQLMSFDSIVTRGLEEIHNDMSAAKSIASTVVNLGVAPTTLTTPIIGATFRDTLKNQTYIWNGILWELQP